jgi:hypothetical protein
MYSGKIAVPPGGGGIRMYVHEGRLKMLQIVLAKNVTTMFLV